MMVIYEQRERIARLREAYMHCPMMTKKLSYSLDKRQRYLFLKGWFKSSFLPTTLQRRSYAYAYVLTNMRPVILADELIVGQPDFDELCGDEEKEAAVFSLSPSWHPNCIIAPKFKSSRITSWGFPRPRTSEKHKRLS